MTRSSFLCTPRNRNLHEKPLWSRIMIKIKLPCIGTVVVSQWQSDLAARSIERPWALPLHTESFWQHLSRSLYVMFRVKEASRRNFEMLAIHGQVFTWLYRFEEYTFEIPHTGRDIHIVVYYMFQCTGPKKNDSQENSMLSIKPFYRRTLTERPDPIRWCEPGARNTEWTNTWKQSKHFQKSKLRFSPCLLA